MKPLSLSAALATLTTLLPALAAAQAAAPSCTSDPDPALAAFGDLAGAAEAVPDPCGGKPLTLADALAAAGATPERDALVRSVLGMITQETGREITPAEIETAIRNPQVLTSLMTVSVPQIVSGLRAAQAASDARGAQPAAAPEYKLPSGVDLADAASYFDATLEPPRTVSGALQRGDRPSDLPPDQIRAHRALGEVLDRLGDNAGKPVGERFRVTYRGRSYSTVNGLLDALERNGHTVTATVSQGVANFLDLFVERDGALCEVEAAVRIRTGHVGPDGREVVVPAVHSGLKIRIRGPDVNGGVSFFQGVGGTRFFAEGLGSDQSWVGGRDVETFTGADAKRAVGIAAMWRKGVNEVAAQKHLFGGGYGQTGLCNDSVALLQTLLTGRTTIYPLAMDHELTTRFLDAKIAEGGPLAARWKELRHGVEMLPRDAVADPSQPGRILESLPFGAGPSPFPGADHAREVLAPDRS